MTDALDVDDMRELRLIKRNAYKAVDEALRKSKSDKVFSEKEIEGLRAEIERLLKEFELCKGNHLETIKQMEGDNDEDIETWEMHVELVHLKWQKVLKI